MVSAGSVVLMTSVISGCPFRVVVTRSSAACCAKLVACVKPVSTELVNTRGNEKSAFLVVAQHAHADPRQRGKRSYLQ